MNQKSFYQMADELHLKVEELRVNGLLEFQSKEKNLEDAIQDYVNHFVDGVRKLGFAFSELDDSSRLTIVRLQEMNAAIPRYSFLGRMRDYGEAFWIAFNTILNFWVDIFRDGDDEL